MSTYPQTSNLYHPAKARTKLPEDLEQDHLVAEEKFDGSRYLLYIGYDPYHRSTRPNTLLSRRLSVKDDMYVDKSDNIPHITQVNFNIKQPLGGPGLTGTCVLDGEVYIPGQEFYTLNGIMNSLPEESIRKQVLVGKVHFMAFDILRINDYGTTPQDNEWQAHTQRERREELEAFFALIPDNVREYLQLIPQHKQGKDNFDVLFHTIVEAGGEGLIIKDQDALYGKGWSKMKRAHDVSTVCMGFKSGTGKYEGQIGAIQLGVYMERTSFGSLTTDGESKMELVEIGFASGMDDALRLEMTECPDDYIGSVVDVHTQGLTSGNRLRHPTYIRFRDDLNSGDCTMEKLKEDLSATKAKATRSK